MEQGKLLLGVFFEITGLQAPFHVNAMPHDARVRARGVEEDAIVGFGQAMGAQGQADTLEQVCLDECDLYPRDPRQILLEAIDPWAGMVGIDRQIDGDEPPGFHGISDEEALAAGGGAKVNDAFAGLGGQKVYGCAGGRILQVDLAGFEQRFDLGPASGQDLENIGPRGGS
ncbi:MAG: hypothetical protein RL077_4246 [Verrucomicrobiota bacterium]